MAQREPRTRGHQRKHQKREEELEQEKQKQKLRQQKREERRRSTYYLLRVMSALKLHSINWWVLYHKYIDK